MSVRSLTRPRSTAGDHGGDVVDPRIAARRRHVASVAGRRRRRRLLAVVAVVTALALGWVVVRSPLLDVDEVTVDGALRTPTDEVLAVAGVLPGDQLVDVDTGAARERLLASPWVADASVSVDWPSAVRVSVQERTPIAVTWRDDGTGWLVDAGGRVLAPARGDEGLVGLEGLVVGDPGTTLDAGAAGVLELLAVLPPGSRSRLEALVLTPAGRLDGRTRDPEAAVWFGEPTELAAKATTLETLFAQVDDEAVLVWDVRVPGTGAVTRTPPPAPPSAPDGDDRSTGGARDGGGGG